MLPRRLRVPGEWFAQKKKDAPAPHRRAVFSAGEVVCYAPLSEQQPRARLAVVVRKKVARKAFLRNRIKRRVFAAARACADELPPGVYLIYPTPHALSLPFEELSQGVCGALYEVSQTSTPQHANASEKQKEK